MFSFSEDFMKLFTMVCFTIVCFIFFITIIEVFVIRVKDMLNKPLIQIQLFLGTIFLIICLYLVKIP